MPTLSSRQPRVEGLLRACHLQPTLAVTGITAALASSAGRGGAGTAAAAAAALAGQLSVGWANDWLDAGRDTAAGRTDKPVVAGAVAVPVVRRAALLALAAAVPLSLLSGLPAAAAHLVAVGAAWAYDLRLKATPFSVLPYAVGFGLLPAFVTLGLPGHPLPPAWAVVAGVLLGSGAHFVNALPDLAADLRTGVRGLPHRLGPARSLAAAAVLLAVAAAVLALAPPGRVGPARAAGLAVALGAVVAVVVAVRSGHERTAWPLTLLAAAASVALLLGQGGSLA